MGVSSCYLLGLPDSKMHELRDLYPIGKHNFYESLEMHILFTFFEI